MRKNWVWLLVVVCVSMAGAGLGRTAAQAATPKAGRAARGGKSGSAREQVARAASVLKKQGLYKGDTSGKWNPELHAAVEAFQKGHGLKETGRLNKETRKALGIDDAGSGGGAVKTANAPGSEERPDP